MKDKIIFDNAIEKQVLSDNFADTTALAKIV